MAAASLCLDDGSIPPILPRTWFIYGVRERLSFSELWDYAWRMLRLFRLLRRMGGPLVLCLSPFLGVAVLATICIWNDGQLATTAGILGAGFFWAMFIGVFGILAQGRYTAKNRLTWGMLLQAVLAA